MHINAKSLKERWLLFYLSSINSGVWNLKHNTIHIISPQSEMLGHNVTHLMSHITVALLLSSNSMWPTLCDPMDCSTPGFPVLHHLLEFSQTHVCWVSDAIQPSLILCHPLLLLLSTFPSIRVFSNESVLHIRWPKYWSFSFSITPSNDL